MGLQRRSNTSNRISSSALSRSSRAIQEAGGVPLVTNSPQHQSFPVSTIARENVTVQRSGRNSRKHNEHQVGRHLITKVSPTSSTLTTTNGTSFNNIPNKPQSSSNSIRHHKHLNNKSKEYLPSPFIASSSSSSHHPHHSSTQSSPLSSSHQQQSISLNHHHSSPSSRRPPIPQPQSRPVSQHAARIPNHGLIPHYSSSPRSSSHSPQHSSTAVNNQSTIPQYISPSSSSPHHHHYSYYSHPPTRNHSSPIMVPSGVSLPSDLHPVMPISGNVTTTTTHHSPSSLRRSPLQPHSSSLSSTNPTLSSSSSSQFAPMARPVRYQASSTPHQYHPRPTQNAPPQRQRDQGSSSSHHYERVGRSQQQFVNASGQTELLPSSNNMRATRRHEPRNTINNDHSHSSCLYQNY